MPTTDIYVNTGQLAGEQCSSGGEGRVLTFEESVLTHPSHTDGMVDGKDPVCIGKIVGVAMKGAAAVTDLIAVDTEGIWWLNVVASNDGGTSAIARGDRIYINTTTCILSKIQTAETQIPFGVACGALGASGTAAVLAVKVHQDPAWEALGYANDSYIWVSLDGDDDGDGSFFFPYLTLATALAAVTAEKKTIMLMPGQYTSAASLAWPDINDVMITGMSADHESTIIYASAGDEAILIAPDAVIGASGINCIFSNLMIGGADGVNGVQITDTNMTAGKKLIVNFRNCGFYNATDTDMSLVSTHTVACLIKIYMDGKGLGGNEISGLVYVDCYNVGDRFRANGMWFQGGVEFSTDTVACENEFNSCIMELNGGAGGQDTQVLLASGCISKDHVTQAAAVLTDFAANAAETLLSLA